MALVKTNVREEVLNDYKNTLLKDRKKLSFDDEIEKEIESEDNEKLTDEEVNIDKSKELEQIGQNPHIQNLNNDKTNLDSHHKSDENKTIRSNRPEIISNVLISCRKNAVPASSVHENREESVISREKDPIISEDRDEEHEMSQDENRRDNIVQRIKLKKYDVYNNQVMIIRIFL